MYFDFLTWILTLTLLLSFFATVTQYIFILGTRSRVITFQYILENISAEMPADFLFLSIFMKSESSKIEFLSVLCCVFSENIGYLDS